MGSAKWMWCSNSSQTEVLNVYSQTAPKTATIKSMVRDQEAHQPLFLPFQAHDF